MKNILLIASLLFTAVSNAHISFVYPEGQQVGFSTMLPACSVEGKIFEGFVGNEAIHFHLKDLLDHVGNGEHVIQCHLEYEDESHYIDFNVLKMKVWKKASSPYPVTDNFERELKYGIISKIKLTSCYDVVDYSYDLNCIKKFYGNNNNYLHATFGELAFEYKWTRYYDSVSISVLTNPMSPIVR